MIQCNQLSITTTKAKLDFHTVKPLMSDTYIKSDLEIQKQSAKLNMQSRNIRCEVDSSACRAEEGLKSVFELADDFAAKGMQDAREAAHDLAVRGQEFVHAKPGQNVILDEIKVKVKERPPLTGIKFIPSQRPEITWHENKLDIDFEPLKQNFSWNVHSRANIEVLRKPQLDIFMTEEPSMHIEYVGDMFKKLDTRA